MEALVCFSFHVDEFARVDDRDGETESVQCVLNHFAATSGKSFGSEKFFVNGASRDLHQHATHE